MIQTYNKWKKKKKNVSVGVFSYFAGMIVIIWLHLSHHGQSIRNPSDWSLSAHDKTFLSGWEQSLPGWLRPQHLMNTIYAVFFPFIFHQSVHFSGRSSHLQCFQSCPHRSMSSTSIHSIRESRRIEHLPAQRQALDVLHSLIAHGTNEQVKPVKRKGGEEKKKKQQKWTESTL